MQTWVQKYEVTGPVAIEVDQMDGAVRIVGWEENAVEVNASWSGEGSIEDRLDYDVTANRIRLKVKPYRPGFLGLLNQDSLLDLELFVPIGSQCAVESGSGPVTAEGTHGPVHIETGSGRIDLESVAGPVQLETTSGSITARRIAQGLIADTASGSIAVVDVEGRVHLESGSGSIAVSRIVSHEMSVETGSGSIRLQALDVKRLFAETGSGTVETELTRIHPDGSYQVETGSGRISVAIPADAGINLELETHGRVDYGGLPVRVVRREGDEVTAVVGPGGPRLAIETGSGSVSLKALPGGAVSSDREVAATRLADLVKDDPALEQSEQMSRILHMVQEGRLSVTEAENLLRALDGEEV